MKCTSVMCGLLLLAVGAAHASCDPRGTFRIVTADMSPGVDQNSFAAKPKIAYRSGRLLARLEEQPDVAAGLHLLFVINAPDSWQINLIDKTGIHSVDHAESKDVHMPVFDSDPKLGIPSELTALEFGCEQEFFADHDTTLLPNKSGSRELTMHRVTQGDWRITMLTEVGSDLPRAMMIAKSGKVVQMIRYLSYGHRDDFDAALFAKPSGIDYHEAE